MIMIIHNNYYLKIVLQTQTHIIVAVLISAVTLFIFCSAANVHLRNMGEGKEQNGTHKVFQKSVCLYHKGIITHSIIITCLLYLSLQFFYYYYFNVNDWNIVKAVKLWSPPRNIWGLVKSGGGKAHNQFRCSAQQFFLQSNS